MRTICVYKYRMKLSGPNSYSNHKFFGRLTFVDGANPDELKKKR